MTINHQLRSFRRRLSATGIVIGATVTAVALSGPAALHAETGAAHASGVVVNAVGAEVGFVQIVEDGTGGVHVNIKVDGLTPGLHGAHLHAVGDCTTPTFGSAAGHHNPTNAEHPSHAGDLPKLVANAAGRGRLNAHLDGFTLTGDNALLSGDGTALIIHAAPDDYHTQPSGNSGDRVACAVIVAG